MSHPGVAMPHLSSRLTIRCWRARRETSYTNEVTDRALNMRATQPNEKDDDSDNDNALADRALLGDQLSEPHVAQAPKERRRTRSLSPSKATGAWARGRRFENEPSVRAAPARVAGTCAGRGGREGGGRGKRGSEAARGRARVTKHDGRTRDEPVRWVGSFDSTT